MILLEDGLWHDATSVLSQINPTKTFVTTRCGKYQHHAVGRKARLWMRAPFEMPDPRCSECQTLPPFFPS